MSLVEAVLLALVQGLTEFLPISSDGHLALAQLVMGGELESGRSALLYDVVLHVATTLAVVVYMRKELWSLRAALVAGPAGTAARKVVMLVVVASVPTAAVGLALKPSIEQAMGEPTAIALGFFGTSVAIASTWRLLRRAGAETAPAPDESFLTDVAAMRWWAAALVGVAQGLAVWPGLSRSGTTIATALWTGARPHAAARFSFLVLLPAVAGACLLEAKDIAHVAPEPLPWLAGFVVAFAVGLMAIGWLVAIVRNAKLPWFGVYTALLGVATLLLAAA